MLTLSIMYIDDMSNTEAATKALASHLVQNIGISGSEAMAIATKTMRYIGMGVLDTHEAATVFAVELATQAARS